MFNKTAPVIEPAPDVTAQLEPTIPLSVIALDLPAPTTGWDAFLADRDIEVVTDDIGRDAVRRSDAARILAEHREQQEEAEARLRELRDRQEQAAIAADRAFRAALPKGLPWYALPDGVSPADAWAQAEKDAQPKRRTLLEDAFAREETLVYHSLQGEADAS